MPRISARKPARRLPDEPQVEHIPTDRPSWMIKSFPTSSTTYPAAYRDDGSTTVLVSSFPDNDSVSFCVVGFSREMKSMLLSVGATIGTCVG